MATSLSFTNTTTTEVLAGTSYDITQSGSSDVTLNFRLPVTIGSDVLQGTDVTAPAVQTDNGSIINFNTLEAQQFAKVTINAPVVANNGVITAAGDSMVDINAKVLGGSGMTFIYDSNVITHGLVGGEQTFNLSPSAVPAVVIGFIAGILTIDDPHTFFGHVNMDATTLTELVGLTASSYSYDASDKVLTLWNGNTPVDRLSFSIPNGQIFSVYQQLGGNTWIGNDQGPNGISGISATIIPQHTAS